MQSWLRASVLAAAVMGAHLTHGSASAADLYNTYPPPRTGSAYDDPRYADLYGTQPPRRHAEGYAPPYKPQHDYRYSHPVPSEPIYRDRYPRQYSEAPRDHHRDYRGEHRGDYRAYSAGPGCLGKDEISFNLERDGWREFHEPQIVDRGTAFVKARRHGRTFQLKLDRCSGDIIAARPVDHRGPYADYERPYRTY